MSFNFDLVIKNGIVVTASDETACDIGVIGGKIAILGVGLPVPEGCTVIDAEGGFVTVRPLQSQVERPKALTSCVLPQPGGVDSHVHVAQSASKAAGARSSDDWTTATRSALGGAFELLAIDPACDADHPSAGGTTTIIAFAVQNRGESMLQAVVDYHELATGNALCDYGFHVIVTDPSEAAMHNELPTLVKDGISSVKIYSTYPALKLSDLQILELMFAARQYGVTVSASRRPLPASHSRP